MSLVIGICGYKGSGKSTVAKHLVNEHGFMPINFKDALVSEVIAKFTEVLIELKKLYKLEQYELFEQKPAVVRALLQNYGTEVRRADDKDYWVKRWEEKVTGSNRNIVTDDVRFFNELTAIKGVNGILIRVKRDDITTGGTHTSETEQESFMEDFTIEGVKGSHDEIYKQVDSIIDTLKKNVD